MPKLDTVKNFTNWRSYKERPRKHALVLMVNKLGRMPHTLIIMDDDGWSIVDNGYTSASWNVLVEKIFEPGDYRWIYFSEIESKRCPPCPEFPKGALCRRSNGRWFYRTSNWYISALELDDAREHVVGSTTHKVHVEDFDDVEIWKVVKLDLAAFDDYIRECEKGDKSRVKQKGVENV